MGAFALTVALLSLGYHQLLPEAPDAITYDWRTALFSTLAEEQRKDITVVLVTEDTLQQYYSRSPTDRALLAEVIRAIDDAEPKAIGLDFVFDRVADPQKTEALITSIRETKSPIVIGAIDQRARRVRTDDLRLQEEFLTKAGRPAGHLFYGSNTRRLQLQEDVVRKIAEPGPSGMVSFAEVLKKEVTGQTGVELSSQFIAWLRPPPKPGTELFPILRIPEHERVDGTGRGETVIPASWSPLLRGRIVLIGGDLIDQDQHQTPMSILTGKRVPGVTIHAQIIAQLLDERSIKTMELWKEALCVFLISAIAFFLGYRFRLTRSDFIFSVAGLVALIAAGMLAFAHWKLVIPSTTLFLGWVGGVTIGHVLSRFTAQPVDPD